MRRIVVVLLLGLLTFSSCKSTGSKSYQGKIKKGKAVPCPVKDC